MDDKKVAMFMALAGQNESSTFNGADEATRRLGAQLLLSEVLEYVIKGLGVTPVVNGVAIEDANNLEYKNSSNPDKVEMLDGLADVAYTMYWNSLAFGAPLEEAFELVCNNNLEKFVALNDWNGPTGILPADQWDCGLDIVWPPEVEQVHILNISGAYFAVGKDKNGKVRKPSSFVSVDLRALVA